MVLGVEGLNWLRLEPVWCFFEQGNENHFGTFLMICAVLDFTYVFSDCYNVKIGSMIAKEVGKYLPFDTAYHLRILGNL